MPEGPYSGKADLSGARQIQQGVKVNPQMSGALEDIVRRLIQHKDWLEKHRRQLKELREHLLGPMERDQHVDPESLTGSPEGTLNMLDNLITICERETGRIGAELEDLKQNLYVEDKP